MDTADTRIRHNYRLAIHERPQSRFSVVQNQDQPSPFPVAVNVYENVCTTVQVLL